MTDFGENTIQGTDDGGNQGNILAQQATLASPGTLQTLSFYVTPGTQAGNMRLGCFTESSALPGALLAETNSFSVVSAWNTQSVITPVLLSAANYWLAYQYDDGGVGLKISTFGIGSFAFKGQAFGAFPGTFGTPDGSGSGHWSLYGTVTGAAGSQIIIAPSYLLARNTLLRL